MLNTPITVVIPTYNRPESIQYFLDNCYSQYSGELFSFEIHDSSTDDKTRDILSEKIGERLHYFRYPSEIVGDEKTMQALSKATNPYVYLLGDGVTVDFNALERFLLANNYQEYAVIGFRCAREINPRYMSSDVNKLVSEECIRSYFQNYFWILTLYGASIVRRDVMMEASKASERYREINSPFMYVCSIFEGLAVCAGKCAFAFVDFVGSNPLKGESGWITKKLAVEFFCYRYFNSMQLLPQMYGATERDFLVKHNRCSGLFSFRSILKLRATGNLTRKIVKQYKFFMKQTVANMRAVYFSLWIPKFILAGLHKTYRVFKGKKG